MKQVVETSTPIAEVARNLGINPGTLGNWVNQYRKENPVSEGLSLPDRARLRELEKEARELRLENAFLKKPPPTSRGGTVSERYAFIAAEQDFYSSQARAGAPVEHLPLVRMCAAMEVSRSGYYDWCRAVPSDRALRRAKVTEHVHAAFKLGRGTDGARRVHAVLTRSDDPQVAGAGLDLVRDIMREEGLVACQPRAYRTTTVRDDDTAPVTDHVDRDFTAPAPGCKLVGDITFVRTWEGWLYLATVIDCHTKAVVGWSMAEHMRTDLICDAIDMAATNVEFAEGALFHSDRGSQYTSAQFATHLKSHGLTASMGKTGICWDNALAKSFFAALKNELVYRLVLPTRNKARRAIAEYIEVFYNRQRLH